MKTLLQINIVGNYGSTGRIAEAIGRLALSNGWESYIAHGRFARPSKSKIIKIGSGFDVFLHVLQTRIFDRQCLGSKQATIKLVKKIKAIKPDIIHLHNLHGYYINISILFDYLANASIPVVWTFHDCWPITGHCIHFDFVGCDKWKSECDDCPQKKEYPASLFFDRSRKNYKLKKELFTSAKNITLVPVSAWLAMIIKESYLGQYSVNIIPNGINLDIFKQIDTTETLNQYGLAEKFVILGVASVWSKRKGLDDFIALSKLIDNKTIILLIGLNKEQMKDLPNNILGIERTDDVNQLAEFYSVAEVYVNPTWEDNFPTTNLEALACGTPVITYNTGGSPESLSNTTGFIVEKGDIDGLFKSIQFIQEKGKLYYSDSCRARAVQLFDKDDRYKDYLNLYEEKIHEKQIIKNEI